MLFRLGHEQLYPIHQGGFGQGTTHNFRHDGLLANKDKGRPSGNLIVLTYAAASPCGRVDLDKDDLGVGMGVLTQRLVQGYQACTPVAIVLDKTNHNEFVTRVLQQCI